MTGYILLSVIGISAISLIGISAIALGEVRTKENSALLVFLVGLAIGALLGDLIIHLLPEIYEEIGTIAVWYLAGGVITFSLIEKILHWRHDHSSSNSRIEPIGWMNLAADGLHNLIDGALVAVAYLVSLPVGVATTLAVALHELPQEFGDYGILRLAGFPKYQALGFNFLSALLAVIGALIVIARGDAAIEKKSFVLAFASGGFIYLIFLLFRRLGHELTPQRVALGSVAFVVGIATMWLVGFLE